MNALHDACLTEFALTLIHATDKLLFAVRSWDCIRRRASTHELRAAKCALAWNHVLWEAREITYLVADWCRIGIEVDELQGRVEQPVATLLIAALQLEQLRQREAPAAAYEDVARRLRMMARVGK